MGGLQDALGLWLVCVLFFAFSFNTNYNNTVVSGVDTLESTGKTTQTIRESHRHKEMARCGL
jgi:hypothetical protein